MVCKKCGNKLTDGINICPYCGEGSNQENVKTSEINSFINDLNSLKIDVENEKQNIEKDKKNIDLEKILEITQDLSNLKYEFDEIKLSEQPSKNLNDLKLEVEETSTKEIETPIVLNEVKIQTQPIEINSEKSDDEYSFVEVDIPNIESIETSDISNSVSLKSDSKEIIENINLEEIKNLSEETVNKETFEINEVEDSNSLIADLDSIKIISDPDLVKENENFEIDTNNADFSKTNIDDLINDLKGIELEKIDYNDSMNFSQELNGENLKDEEEKRLNIYDLVNELKSVNIEGIKSIPNPSGIPPVPMIEEAEIKSEPKFENEYLFKAEEQINNSIDSKEITLSNTENNEEIINNGLIETNLQEIDLEDANIDEESESGDVPEMTLPPFPEVLQNNEEEENIGFSIENNDVEPSKQEVFINENLNETKELIENSENNKAPIEKSNKTFLIVFIIVAIIGVALAIYLAYLLAQHNLSK